MMILLNLIQDIFHNILDPVVTVLIIYLMVEHNNKVYEKMVALKIFRCCCKYLIDGDVVPKKKKNTMDTNSNMSESELSNSQRIAHMSCLSEESAL